MKLYSDVIEALAEAIPPDAVHPADQSAGIYGNYVTAQWAMQEANAIFGTDGVSDFELLDKETIEIPIPGESFGNWVFITTVKVWFSVLMDDDTVHRFSRIGRGVGTAQCPRRSGNLTPVRPQQLDTAAKASLSDAIKNAMMRSGRRLGAQLYFNEREAQVLGYEMASDGSDASGDQQGGGSTSTRSDLESIGQIECKFGFGTPDDEGVKPYTGWTIEKMWSDPDGRGVFDWAVDKEATGFFNEKLREYARLMSLAADETAERVKEEYGQSETVTIWTGEEKPAGGKIRWDVISSRDDFVTMLAETFNPDGERANFGPNHKRMRNHYMYHFGVAEPRNWAMLDALVMRCKGVEGAAAVAYPDWYGDRVEEEEQEPEEELPPLGDNPVADVHNSSLMDIGPRRDQKMPSELQVLIKDAFQAIADTNEWADTDDYPNPNDWIWSVVMKEKPVGDWTMGHTDLAMKIIAAVKEGTAEYDNELTHVMWTFGISQLGTD